MVPWYLYAGFIAFVLAMLLVDLKLFHRDEREPTPKESGTWVAIWVALAIVFGVIVFFWRGPQVAGEFFAGYLIEYSLSVDNMFVFVLIFTYFRVPFAYQHQVLFYGILGALIFRGLFIWAGVALIQNFEWVIYVFGAFLVFTAVRLARGGVEVHPEDNPVLKFLQRRVRTTTRYYGQQFFTIENGKRLATPLLVVLLFIEMTDIIFAVDSIPAIFGITERPFIVLTSNVFAILGLRALYFLLADVIDRFHLLRYGLAAILGFVGIKMLATAVTCRDVSTFCDGHHVTVPIWMSLVFIIVVLAVTVYLSLRFPPPDDEPPKGEEPPEDDETLRPPRQKTSR